MVKIANRPTNKSAIATVLLSTEKFSMEDIRETERDRDRDRQKG